MSEQPKSDSDFVKKRPPMLYVIIAFKLLKGVFALLLAFAIMKLVGKDLQEIFHHFLESLRLDPERRFFANLLVKIGQITPANVRWAAAGTMIYGLFFLVEGVGLTFRAWWAGWLTIGETAFFIPVELFELIRHFSWPLAVILAANIVVVWYLFANRKRLFHHHHHH